MGPIASPPLPVAWRERYTAPFGSKQVGLEVLGKTNKQGQPAIYWGKDCAECYELAEADGWQF